MKKCLNIINIVAIVLVFSSSSYYAVVKKGIEDTQETVRTDI